MTQGPTPGTKPLRGTHDLGEIVGYSYRIYARNFLPFFALALLTVPFQLLAGTLEQRLGEEYADEIFLWLWIPTTIVQLVIAAAVIWGANAVADGETPSFASSLDAVLDRFGQLFGASLLGGTRAFLALGAVPFLAVYWLLNRDATIDGRRDWFFAIIPFSLFVYLVIRWLFVAQAVMISGERSWAALDDSADAVRTNWWRTFGINLLLVVIALGPAMIASPAAQLEPLVEAAIFGVVIAVLLPVYGIGQTLLYYDLKTRAALRTTAQLLQESPQSEETTG